MEQTFPEAAVSVTAAVKGEPDLTLGNAVGSIIFDTGSILGLYALISPLPLSHSRFGIVLLAVYMLVTYLSYSGVKI